MPSKWRNVHGPVPAAAMQDEAANAFFQYPHSTSSSRNNGGTLKLINTAADVSQPELGAPATSALPNLTIADNIRPLLRERLPRGQTAYTYRGYIRGAADFSQQSVLYQSLTDKEPGSAADFPQDDAELRALAKGLTDAMTNMADAVEAGKKSVTRIHQLSPYEIELKSWQLLFIIRDVQMGIVNMHLWGAQWGVETFDTFSSRYENIRLKLKLSKSLVSSLFDQEFSIRLALNPGSELKKKLANSKNNSRRAVDLAGIRDHRKRTLSARKDGEEEDQENYEDDDEDKMVRQGGSRPAKRSRGRGGATPSITGMPVNNDAGPESTLSGSKGYDFIQEHDFEVDFNFDGDHQA